MRGRHGVAMTMHAKGRCTGKVIHLCLCTRDQGDDQTDTLSRSRRRWTRQPRCVGFNVVMRSVAEIRLFDNRVRSHDQEPPILNSCNSSVRFVAQHHTTPQQLYILDYDISVDCLA